MKKVMYTVAMVLFATILFTACTKEEVKPSGTTAPGGVTIRE